MEAGALARPRPSAAPASLWAAALAAALAGLLLTYSPALAFAAAGLPLFAYGVIWHPKATAGVGALLILFSQPVGQLAPPAKLIDEESSNRAAATQKLGVNMGVISADAGMRSAATLEI